MRHRIAWLAAIVGLVSLGAPLAAAIATVIVSDSPRAQTKAPAVPMVESSAAVKDGVLSLRVQDVQPLLRGVDALERLCGCRITYEAAPLESMEDLHDGTVREFGERRSLYARGGPLEIRYSVGPGGLPSSIEGAVLELIRAHEERGYPGEYSLEKDGGLLHVVPTRIRSEDGSMTTVSSVLDARISLPERDALALSHAEAIVAALRRVSKREIVLGGVPPNAFRDQRMRLGADNEPARAVLLRLLEALPAKLAWRLMFEPGNRRHLLWIR